MTGRLLEGKCVAHRRSKRKVTAAHRSGIKEVILPDHNKKDLEDVPSNVAKDMIFHFERVKDVLKVAVLILILL